MRGACRSLNTLARTADRRPLSAPAAVGRTAATSTPRLLNTFSSHIAMDASKRAYLCRESPQADRPACRARAICAPAASGGSCALDPVRPSTLRKRRLRQAERRRFSGHQRHGVCNRSSNRGALRRSEGLRACGPPRVRAGRREQSVRCQPQEANGHAEDPRSRAENEDEAAWHYDEKDEREQQYREEDHSG